MSARMTLPRCTRKYNKMMELSHCARREGRLSSFLRGEMKMSEGLMNRLKWADRILVNGQPEHTNYPVRPGDEITVLLDEAAAAKLK